MNKTNKHRYFEESDEEILIYLPDKSVEKVPSRAILRNAGKPYIRKIYSQTMQRYYNDCFLQKVGTNKFKLITDRQKERNLWREEQLIWEEGFNKVICECPSCTKPILGRQITSLEKLKRTNWEVSFNCPYCQFEGMIIINESVLVQH